MENPKALRNFERAIKALENEEKSLLADIERRQQDTLNAQARIQANSEAIHAHMGRIEEIKNDLTELRKIELS